LIEKKKKNLYSDITGSTKILLKIINLDILLEIFSRIDEIRSVKQKKNKHRWIQNGIRSG